MHRAAHGCRRPEISSHAAFQSGSSSAEVTLLPSRKVTMDQPGRRWKPLTMETICRNLGRREKSQLTKSTWLCTPELPEAGRSYVAGEWFQDAYMKGLGLGSQHTHIHTHSHSNLSNISEPLSNHCNPRSQRTSPLVLLINSVLF